MSYFDNCPYPLIRASFGYLRDVEGRLLMVANDYGHQGVMWGVPGGSREEGETAEDTVVREFAEEVGLDIRVTRRVGLIRRIRDDWKMNLAAEFFEVESDSLAFRIDPNEEHVIDAKFVTIEEIKALPGAVLGRGRLLEYLADPENYPDYVEMTQEEE